VELTPGSKSTFQKKGSMDMETAFLTGATGYIGAFLLSELLKQTDDTVYCLVRADSADGVMARLREMLTHYQIWDERAAARVVPVAGDLGQPQFGLSCATFDELAEVDRIYHCGALVNFSYPYSALKAANVRGTQEVLRLACKTKRKSVHHLSTLDVLSGSHQPRPWAEQDLPRQPKLNPDGYPLSKWHAEQLVSAAKRRGVPTVIYRPGWTLGHTVTGASPSNNFLLQALSGFLDLGVLPEIPVVTDPMAVDDTARAILHVSRREESIGKVYHLWNPRTIRLSDAYAAIRSFGYDVEVVPPAQAYRLASKVDTSHRLYPLVPELFPAGAAEAAGADPGPQDAVRDPAVECANLLAAIKDSEFTISEFDEQMIHRMLGYLVSTGFLKPPGTASSARAVASSARAMTGA
jgi:myxalamid-type nonribosomal peptide synthetase MxaA